MTTWTNISNAAVAVGGIPSSTTVTALRDNPSAIAESANGAPVVASGWHPYDKVSVGDGKAGVIYDFAVNGAVTTVTSPDFEDGYEYRFFGYFEPDATFQLFRETSADWVSTGSGISVAYWFDVTVLIPRISKPYHLVLGGYGRGGTAAAVNVTATFPNFSSVTNKMLRARLSSGTPSTGGKIWMFRRREYASAP